MGLCALIFKYIGISMGWLYEFMGTLLGSAVVPIALCISVKKANKMGCIVGALVGFASGITGKHCCGSGSHTAKNVWQAGSLPPPS